MSTRTRLGTWMATAAMLLAGLARAHGQEVLITPTGAAATAGLADNLWTYIDSVIDNSGLSTPISTNSTDGGHHNNQWYPNGVSPAIVTFDLGANYDLTDVVIWQHNDSRGGSFANRGVKNFEIYVASNRFANTGDYVKVAGPLTLAQSTTSTSEPAQVFPLPVTNVRKVMLRLIDSWGSGVGLSEVKFIGSLSVSQPNPFIDEWSVIKPTAVTATSTSAGSADNLLAGFYTHTGNIEDARSLATSWRTDNALPQSLSFELPAMTNLQGVLIWNYKDSANQGVSNFNVYVSTTGIAGEFEAVDGGTLTAPIGSDGASLDAIWGEHCVFLPLKTKRVNAVRLEILGNWGGSGAGLRRVRFVAAPPEPGIETLSPTMVQTDSAIFNGHLTVDQPDAEVILYWGTTPGGTTPGLWDEALHFPGFQSPGPISTNLSLSPNAIYHYRYYVESAVGGPIWANDTISFTTGELWFDPATATAWEEGSEGEPITATVTVHRAEAVTNLTLNVEYDITGSAINGLDYTALTGQFWMPAGVASMPVVVAPWNDLRKEPSETAIFTLRPLNYAIGSPNEATVTIIDAPSTNYTGELLLTPVGVAVTHNAWGGAGVLIDNSGLSTPIGTNSVNSGGSSDQWYSGSGNVYATFDLGANYDLSAAVLWQYADSRLGQYTNRGVKHFELYVADKRFATPDMYLRVPGVGRVSRMTAVPTGADIFDGLVVPNVRKIRIRAIDNWGDSAALGEVKFIGRLSAIQPPAYVQDQDIITPASVAVANFGTGDGGNTEAAAQAIIAHAFVSHVESLEDAYATTSNWDPNIRTATPWTTVTFALPTSMNLFGAWIWPYNRSSFAARGLKTLDIQVSSGGTSGPFTSVSVDPFTLDMSGSNSGDILANFPQFLSFGTEQRPHHYMPDVNAVRFVMLEGWTSGWGGLTKVRFITGPAPPVTGSLFLLR